MSNQNNDKCPLCMDKMDLTDKQLKPCKCGYEVNIEGLILENHCADNLFYIFSTGLYLFGCILYLLCAKSLINNCKTTLSYSYYCI